VELLKNKQAAQQSVLRNNIITSALSQSSAHHFKQIRDQAFSGLEFFLIPRVPPEEHRDDVRHSAGKQSPRRAQRHAPRTQTVRWLKVHESVVL
jgi:hypothetical protein